MNKQELELAAILLEMASDKFSNFGCNDFELPNSWTQEQCDRFLLDMQTWNGDPENFTAGETMTMDYFAMSFLSARLREESEKE